MHKRLGLLSVASSFITLSTAVAQKSTTIGPVAGLNIATFGGEDAEGVSSRTAFLVGAFAAFQMSPKFLLEPSVLYTQKGGQVDFDENVNGTIKLTYIQVPLLARYRLGSGKVVPNLILGPAVGFKTSCKGSASQGSIEINVDCDEADLQVSGTDFSLIGGAGLEVSKFMFSVRYDYGMSSLASDGDTKIYNRTFSVVAQYGFRLN